MQCKTQLHNKWTFIHWIVGGGRLRLIPFLIFCRLARRRGFSWQTQTLAVTPAFKKQVFTLKRIDTENYRPLLACYAMFASLQGLCFSGHQWAHEGSLHSAKLYVQEEELPILYSNLLYKMGIYFLVIQYYRV